MYIYIFTLLVVDDVKISPTHNNPTKIDFCPTVLWEYQGKMGMLPIFPFMSLEMIKMVYY